MWDGEPCFHGNPTSATTNAAARGCSIAATERCIKSLSGWGFGEGHKVGLLLVATAAGAPFLIKLTQAADGDLALASGLLVLLLVVTIVYMPIVVPLIVPGTAVSTGAIARPLVLTSSCRW